MNAKIVNHGMGGFLNPPGHPEHNFSVVYDIVNNCCLSDCIKNKDFPAQIRAECQKLLDEWEENKPHIQHPDVQDWIYQVMGYFRNCYRNPLVEEENQWDATKILILPQRNPLEYEEECCSVHLIREYYPLFKLKQKHIDKAYWGTKPQ